MNYELKTRPNTTKEREYFLSLEDQYAIMGHRGMLKVIDNIYPIIGLIKGPDNLSTSYDGFILQFCEIVHSKRKVINNIDMCTSRIMREKNPLCSRDYEFLKDISVIDNEVNRQITPAFKAACLFEFDYDTDVRRIEESNNMQRHYPALTDCVNFYEQECLKNVCRGIALKDMLLKTARDIQHYIGLYDPINADVLLQYPGLAS